MVNFNFLTDRYHGTESQNLSLNQLSGLHQKSSIRKEVWRNQGDVFCGMGKMQTMFSLELDIHLKFEK